MRGRLDMNIKAMLGAIEALANDLQKASSQTERVRVYATIRALMFDLKDAAKSKKKVRKGCFREYSGDLLRCARALAGLETVEDLGAEKIWRSINEALEGLRGAECFNIGA
jgi:hypothetical protein